MNFTSAKETILLVFIAITCLLSACTGVHDLFAVRQGRDALPDTGKFVFDPKVDAFRFRQYSTVQKNKTLAEGSVLRTSTGEKIRTEAELKQLIEISNLGSASTGSQVTYFTMLGIGATVAIPVDVAVGIVTSPAYFLAVKERNDLKNKSEVAYSMGRKSLLQGNLDTSLKEFAHAKFLMPSLQAYSDVDYWRGEALLKLREYERANEAYLSFIQYSEASIPEYFEEKYEKDSTLAEKISQAKKFISQIIAMLSGQQRN